MISFFIFIFSQSCLSWCNTSLISRLYVHFMYLSVHPFDNILTRQHILGLTENEFLLNACLSDYEARVSKNSQISKKNIL